MTLSQSIALTAGGVVIFTLAVVALAARVYGRAYGARRGRRVRCDGAPAAAASPAARSAGTRPSRGGRHAEA